LGIFFYFCISTNLIEMKNLLWGLFAFATLAHAQGTVTDIDGNTYDYLTYGDQVWTVENAEMVTYRDGTRMSLMKFSAVFFLGIFIIIQI
jgi:hypothetical protein